MQNRCEQRTVIDWNIIEPTFLLGFRISVGISPTDEPEDGRCLPFCSEASKIFARWSGSGVHYAIGGEMRAKSVDHAVARLLVVYVKRIAVERRKRSRSSF